MKKLFLFFLLFVTVNVIAQFGDKSFYLVDSLNLNEINKYDLQLIDSSLTFFHNVKEDTTKISILASLSENIEDQGTWPKYNQLVYDLSVEKLKQISPENKRETFFYLDYKNRALINLGYLYIMQGKVDIALKYYERSKEILEITNDKPGLAAYYNSVGYIHINQGSIKQGLDLLIKSLKIREKLDDLDAIATSLTNIGYVYKNQNEFEKALEYFEKSLKIRRLLNDKGGEALCLGHLGSLYDSQNQKEKANEYYHKALEISEQTNNEYSTAYHLHNIGTILFEKKKYDKAIEYQNRSLTLRKKINDLGGIAASNCKLGNIYFEQNNMPKAYEFAQESMRLAEKLNYPKEISEAAALLQKIYRKQNKWQDAYKMFEIQITMRDSLNNEETQKAAISQQMQYTYEKEKLADSLEFATQQAIKDLVIKESNAKIEVQKAESKILYGGVFLLILLVAAALWAFRSKNRDNEIISIQKELVEEKNKEIVDSIKYAKRIQTAILPSDSAIKDKLKNAFILYKPKDIVAGDFYWMETIGNESRVISRENPTPNTQHSKHIILFAAADCTGHGVPGAMVSVVCNNALNRSVREHGLTDPGQILDKTREIVIQEFEKSDEKVSDGMDIALCVLEGYNLMYAGANNPLWIIRSRHSVLDVESPDKEITGQASNDEFELIEVKATKQPIGKFDNPQPYLTHKIELEKGDTIYLFSDGFVDQFGGKNGKKYKAANYRKLLLSIQQEPMDKQKQLINTTFDNWKGNLEQVDDVCIIGVRV
jgi:serine phosphatase RsbU (regulator of sigma subunit)